MKGRLKPAPTGRRDMATQRLPSAVISAHAVVAVSIVISATIVDRTGLDGYFDVDLQFTPDRIPNFGPGGPPPGMPAIDPNAASIYAAMQEQLGPKLESQRAPIDVLVIDRVETPTAD